MRYAKGSLSLNRKEDKFVLEFVADSRYVTRSQLFEFARLEYGEYNRPVFNWRIRRMVEVGLLRKHAVPIAGGDVLYSINRAGVQALERLGTYYLGAHLERDRDADQFQIPHSLELNEIRLALLRTCFLVRWIPESFIRVVNLSPLDSYAKVYDGIATLDLAGQRVDLAVEYERTLKSPAKYEKIREAIESEKRIAAFLYLVPTRDLLLSLLRSFWRTKQFVLFGMVGDFKRERLGATVYEANYNRIPLVQALTRVGSTKAGT